MALLEFPLTDSENRTLVWDDIYLRFPTRQDYDAWAALRADSRDHLQPFEPRWQERELDKESFRKRLRLYTREIRTGAAQPFLVFNSDHQLVGGCTLSNIRRRAAMTATLGYWVGKPFVRRGVGSKAVAAVLDHAFHTLGLYRVEAACLPRNKASIGVLEKNGFRQEGVARAYLNINGQREDHLLFARLRDDPPR